MQTKPASLRARLFWAFALITIIAVALPAYFFGTSLYRDRIDLAGKEALAHAIFARSVLESNPSPAQLDRLFATAKDLSFRMTLMDSRGAVLRDSHVGGGALAELDNHADRPEIEEAHAKGAGVSLRHSNTLGLDAVYAAVMLDNGGVLRVAAPLADIRQSLQQQLPALIAMVCGVGLFCLLLSALITGKVRDHMDDMAEVVACIARNTGEPGGKRRVLDVRWIEMQPLALAVNHMADTIEAQVTTTTDQRGQLETILDSMQEGVLVLGPGGSVRRWNKAMEGLFPNIAKAQGKPLIEGIPYPLLQHRVDAVLAKGKAKAAGAFGSPKAAGDNDGTGPDCGRTGPDGRGTETDGIRPGAGETVHFEMPSGRFLVAHVSGPATPNPSLGAVIVIYDATEIMRLERVRRDFVSNVSHELRTPLTAITGYAETLLESDDIKAEYRRFAGIIHKHAAALAGIISDLLSLARLENTREQIDLTPQRADEAVQNAVAAVSEQARAKGVDIQLAMDPVPVLANTNLLTQVFRNLLENACRYSPENNSVRVVSRRTGAEVLFAVTDNGPGIPPEALPRIFERFYQVKKERNSGTAGIGLAVCKHIIERHNGRIWAESPHGDAATAMLFTLPAAPEDNREECNDKL